MTMMDEQKNPPVRPKDDRIQYDESKRDAHKQVSNLTYTDPGDFQSEIHSNCSDINYGTIEFVVFNGNHLDPKRCKLVKNDPSNCDSLSDMVVRIKKKAPNSRYGTFKPEQTLNQHKSSNNLLIEKSPEDVFCLNLQNQMPNDSTSYDEHNPAYVHELDYLENRKVARYTLTKSLGVGASSRVRLGQCGNEQVAIKIIKRENKDIKKENRIYKEVLISCMFNHQHIARLIDFYYNESYFFLVFEYIAGQQLLDIVLEHGALSERDAKRYFAQILSAVSYIHGHSICHRDLKIENILVDHKGNIKIIDFGLSNFYDKQKMLNTFCGSLYFAAPELLHGRTYNGPEVDIWSLGIILYVLLNGKVPFDDKDLNKLHAKIKEAKLVFHKNISKQAKHLIRSIVNSKPRERYALDALLAHEWLADQDIIAHTKTDHNVEYDEKVVTILHNVFEFDLPYFKNEVLTFFKHYKRASVYEKDYWLKKPSVAFYMLFHENFKQLQTENIIEKASNQQLDAESTAMADTPSENTSNILPRLKKAILKGFIKGVHFNAETADTLRTQVLDFLQKYCVRYEISESNYVCSTGRGIEYVSFKISLYLNLLLRTHFLSVTRLTGSKAHFKILKKKLKEYGKLIAC